MTFHRAQEVADVRLWLVLDNWEQGTYQADDAPDKSLWREANSWINHASQTAGFS